VLQVPQQELLELELEQERQLRLVQQAQLVLGLAEILAPQQAHSLARLQTKLQRGQLVRHWEQVLALVRQLVLVQRELVFPLIARLN
jgi:hypothetical protein